MIMRTSTTVRRSSRGPRRAIGLSLLAFAVVLAAAVYLPGRLARSPQVHPVQAIDPQLAQLQQARTQAALVTAEDTRLLSQLRGIPWNGLPYRNREHGMHTLVLTARPAPYTLDSLLILKAARRVNATTIDLINSVLLGPGAQLILHAPDTTLRMTSTPPASPPWWGGKAPSRSPATRTTP
jgi:hypothetical protein